MVLEENLLFYKEEDADAFIRFLREKNCRVQKLTESSIFEETLMFGTIGNMIHVIESAMEGKPPKPLQNPKEGESAELALDDSALHAGEKAMMLLHAKMLENLKSIRNHCSEIMTRWTCGDKMFSKDEFTRMKKSVSAILENGPDKEQFDLLKQELFMHDCFQILENNGIVETKPEGMILLKKIDPNDLNVERKVWDPDMAGPEILKTYNITLNHQITFETATRVVIDPRIYFSCPPEEIEKFLDDLEADEDIAIDLIHNLYLKSLAIDCIMNIIETSGRIALPDLIREMDSVTPKESDDDIKLILNSSSVFITSIVNDLRKIGVIEGNDRKIRMSGNRN